MSTQRAYKWVTWALCIALVGQAATFVLYARVATRQALTVQSQISSLQSRLDSQENQLSMHREQLQQAAEALSSAVATLSRRMDNLDEEARLAVRAEVDTQLITLGARMSLIVEEGRSAVEREAETQLRSLVSRSVRQLQDTTLSQINARRIVVVDGQAAERIVLGTGTSEFSGQPNVSIKLISPSGRNPIVLSATDQASGVIVSRRAAMQADEAGEASVELLRTDYGRNQRAAVVMSVSPASSLSGGLFVFGEENRVREGLGLVRDNLAFSEVYNSSGELVYAVQSDDGAYPNTFVKASLASRIWNALGAGSTFKTYWDLLRK